MNLYQLLAFEPNGNGFAIKSYHRLFVLILRWVDIPIVFYDTISMSDFIILALAINPLWLPMFVNFVFDGISMMSKSDVERNEMQRRYSNGELSKREKIIAWIVVPVGWLAAVYLLTERAGVYNIFDVTK